MAKLLYVEDNEMNRDMLSRRLSRRGYDIIMAFDGQAGLDMMRSEAPDLVLMDCLLYTSPSPRDATLSRMPSSA